MSRRRDSMTPAPGSGSGRPFRKLLRHNVVSGRSVRKTAVKYLHGSCEGIVMESRPLAQVVVPAGSAERAVAKEAPVGSWQLLATAGWAFLVVGGMDVGLVWYPAAFGNAGWEFGSITTSLNGLPLPLMGLALVLASATARAKLGQAGPGPGRLGAGGAVRLGLGGDGGALWAHRASSISVGLRPDRVGWTQEGNCPLVGPVGGVSGRVADSGLAGVGVDQAGRRLTVHCGTTQSEVLR